MQRRLAGTKISWCEIVYASEGLTFAPVAVNIFTGKVDWKLRCGRGKFHEWSMPEGSSIQHTNQPEMKPTKTLTKSLSEADNEDVCETRGGEIMESASSGVPCASGSHGNAAGQTSTSCKRKSQWLSEDKTGVKKSKTSKTPVPSCSSVTSGGSESLGGAQTKVVLLDSWFMCIAGKGEGSP